MVALDEAQDVTGRLGRPGIGLKTEVDVWGREATELRLVRRNGWDRYEKKPCKQHFSDNQVATLR